MAVNDSSAKSSLAGTMARIGAAAGASAKCVFVFPDECAAGSSRASRRRRMIASVAAVVASTTRAVNSMLHQANGCRETCTRTGVTIVAGGLEISTAAFAGAGAVAGSSTVGAGAGDNAVAAGAVGGSE